MTVRRVVEDAYASTRSDCPATPELRKHDAEKDSGQSADGEADFRTLPSVGTWFTGPAQRLC